MNLELGNATPVIVAADADLDDIAARLAAHAFSFAGQSCISVQRIYVERSAYDAFLERFVPRVDALVVGDPVDDATDVGPLISPSERDRVLSWIEEATAGGARVLAGGARRRAPATDGRRRRAARCEGRLRGGLRPAVHGTPYDSLDEAIGLANGTRYGLQAGIFTRDVEAALRAARELEFGG